MTDEQRIPATVIGRASQFPPATEEWFQTLEPVRAQEMIGLWQGAGMPSGHPLDGVLENLGWFGKQFHADMRADALLFQGRPGRLVAIDPALIPLRLALRFSAFGRTFIARNWFSYLRRALRAQGTTASLHGGDKSQFQTAVMAYDRLPIADHFRWTGEDEVAGMMVVEGDRRRYFFGLKRVGV
ncbi:DUF4334 domain-containing protein [Rhizobium sp. XQZ8]|uniref:GXWXG domain-containing protein n=1 Tax=Rhizobium populisoli TaxID=2859785 RepID=UPI001C66D1D3|nr:GXWXG domain-containing protein [Rhizobium populisoli]MBW6425205.1 DUF4334 domain-containing protein [Rhizobium populisoli]